MKKDNFAPRRRGVYQVIGLGVGIYNKAGERLRVQHPPRVKLNRRVQIDRPHPVDASKPRNSFVRRRWE